MPKAPAMVLLAATCTLPAQNAPERKPWHAFFAERQKLQQQAKAAYDAEMAREKAGDCAEASTTVDIVACMGKAIATSTANYKTYAGALRSMLAQNPEGDKPPVAGPTGYPLTAQERLNEFDRMEAAWTKYRDAMCSGAADLYKSGTAWQPSRLFCEMTMLRSHMRELGATYGAFLSH